MSSKKRNISSAQSHSYSEMEILQFTLKAVFHLQSPDWGVFWRHGAEGSARVAAADNTPAAAGAVLAGPITRPFFLTSLSHSLGALVTQGQHHCPGAEHIKVSPSTVRSSPWRRLVWHRNALSDSWLGDQIKARLLFSAGPRVCFT